VTSGVLARGVVADRRGLLPANPPDTSRFRSRNDQKRASSWFRRIWLNGRTAGFNAVRVQAGNDRIGA
jgi:hypothetical protein